LSVNTCRNTIEVGRYSR